MHRYTAIYTLVLVLIIAGEASGQAAGRSTALFDNVVCMSLPVYVLSLLLPAEKVSDVFLAVIDGFTAGDLSPFMSTGLREKAGNDGDGDGNGRN